MRVNLFNSNNPNGKRVPVTINIEVVDLVQSNDGEVLYIIGLHVGTVGLDGNRIDPVFINNVTKENILKEIENGLSTLGQLIDWGTLEADIYAPIITELSPVNNNTNVSIDSNVLIRLKDSFPASFIDPSSIKLKANGIDVTPNLQIKERDNEVSVLWVPIKIKNSN